MSTLPIEPGAIPANPISLPALRLLTRHSPHEIAEAIEIMIDVLDIFAGDSDVELNGDEDDDPGDLQDGAWIEWGTRGRHKIAAAGGEVLGPLFLRNEDVEDDDPGGGNVDDEPHDPEEDRCPAGDDGVFSGGITFTYGVPLCQDEDMEREQMPDDVPCLAVYSLEPNPFNGERTFLGMDNLQVTFVGVPGDNRGAPAIPVC